MDYMFNDYSFLLSFIIGAIFTILWFSVKSPTKTIRIIMASLLLLYLVFSSISSYFILKTEIGVEVYPFVIKEHYYAKKLPNVSYEGGVYEGADTDLFQLKFSLKTLNNRSASNFKERIKIVSIKNGVEYKLLDTLTNYPNKTINDTFNLVYPFRCKLNFFGDTTYVYLKINFSNGIWFFPQKSFEKTFCNYGRPSFIEVEK